MNEEEIEGVISAREFDHEGYPVSYSLITDDDEEIEIVENELVDQIADYENERILAIGRIKNGPNGKRIWIADFDPLEDSDAAELSFDDVGEM